MLLRLLFMLLFVNAATPRAQALELGLGLSAIEEGDDRLRPGVLGHINFLGNYTSRLFYYGREFGPVTERTILLSAFRRFDLFKMLNINFIHAGLGVALMNEQTVIDLPTQSTTENNPNLGFVFGVHGDVPNTWSGIYTVEHGIPYVSRRSGWDFARQWPEDDGFSSEWGSALMKYFRLMLLFVVVTNPSFVYGQSEKKERLNAKAKPVDKQKPSKKKRSGDCGMGTSDGKDYNQTHGVALKLGPPGAQNGHSNPLGIPPGIQDIEVTYLHRCGIEGSVGLVPGITGGLRYRGGKYLYGSAGGGILLTANGLGPGVYTAVGATLSRTWPVTFEVEFKQGIGLGVGSGGSHLIFPYSFRLGAGFYW